MIAAGWGLAVTFVILPRVLFAPPRATSAARERSVIDLIRMSALLIVIAHVLVPMRLFQLTGLVIAFVAWFLLHRLRRGGWTLSGLQCVSRWQRMRPDQIVADPVGKEAARFFEAIVVAANNA